MATFGEKMADVAQSLTRTFSEEIGLSTVKRLGSDAYNPDTGVYTPVYTTSTAYVVYTKIESEEPLNEKYMQEHEQAIVAGDDLTFAPKNGDIIVKPDATEHRIVNVKADKYGAAYVMHVERKNA